MKRSPKASAPRFIVGKNIAYSIGLKSWHEPFLWAVILSVLVQPNTGMTIPILAHRMRLKKELDLVFSRVPRLQNHEMPFAKQWTDILLDRACECEDGVHAVILAGALDCLNDFSSVPWNGLNRVCSEYLDAVCRELFFDENDGPYGSYLISEEFKVCAKGDEIRGEMKKLAEVLFAGNGVGGTPSAIFSRSFSSRPEAGGLGNHHPDALPWEAT